jgi:hypothetical protein
MTTASMGAVAAQSDDFVCAGCGQHLEVQEANRLLASTAGIAAGYAALHFTRHLHLTLGWAAPVLFALLGYGCVSALVLMLTADVVLKPVQTQAVTPVESGHGHGHH